MVNIINITHIKKSLWGPEIKNFENAVTENKLYGSLKSCQLLMSEMGSFLSTSFLITLLSIYNTNMLILLKEGT